MRASILFTVASLFLIGSHSLPQPVNLDAKSSIKERQAHYQTHGTHTMPPQAIQWCESHPDICSHYSSGSNSTTMVKRQAPRHYQLPDGMSWEEFKKNWRHGKQEADGSTGDGGDGGDGSGTNGTTVKMRKWRD